MNNIIICSPQLGIAPESNSGGEVYDREVIRALCDQGIKVIVILPRGKLYTLHENLKVCYLPVLHVWPPYLFNFFIIPYLFWLYRKEKFNILRIHSPYFVGIGAFIFKLFFSQILLEAHYHHLEDNKLFYHLINKILINRWDMITVDSKYSKEELIMGYRVNKNKIKVIYAGVNNKYKVKNKNSPLLYKYGLKRSKVLLFLGELKFRKNVAFLIKLIARLRIKNCKLLICGSGYLANKLRNLSKDLSITDKVVFTGFINEVDKVDFYNLADIFLFPSIKEGFGMPVIEAGACGVPAIVSNTSSLKELIIDGKTGYLAALNDPNDWRLKIEKLLGDNDLRRKMGKEARKFSQNFSWRRNTKAQIDFYKKLFQSKADINN